MLRRSSTVMGSALWFGQAPAWRISLKKPPHPPRLQPRYRASPVETADLGDLIEKEAPDEVIEAEFDRRCMQYFGFARHELTDSVPAVVLSGLEDWYYEEVLHLGQRHGFDFRDKARNEELSMSDDVWNVIPQWPYFAEMLIAKECGYFPSTSVELATMKLNRDTRRFEEEMRRQRQQPRPEILEREQVFGKRQRDIKPGTIVAPLAKGKGTKGAREIRIEVRPRDRRPPSGPSKRP
jgi:hypothetical protein